ncbi:MAG: sulfotransferase family protein [Opitutales bacterium]|nr:sulfotransferase family protein [Opitutales bacterium]
MSEQSPKRISVWSGPRNVSTALMYSFAQRADTKVFDEPLYAHYLSSIADRPEHPGERDILRAQENVGRRVVDSILMADQGKPVLFFKNMAHHLVDLDWDFLDEMTNILLTRQPRDMLHSYSKMIPEFGLSDTGYDKLKQLADAIVAKGQEPVVIDSKRLLESPESILRQLCDRVGIQFEESMLSWEAGPKPDEGVWAPHWYHNAHRSSGFVAYKPKTDEFPERLQPLLEECQELYDELLPFAIE